ncbi:unnamed protein product [Scytosiphon promiscuus]
MLMFGRLPSSSFLVGNLAAVRFSLRGTATMSTDNNPYGFMWHRSMLRTKDPTASVKYYEERYGMKLVDVYHTPGLGKSNYYLASLRDGEAWPEPGTLEAHQRLFDMQQSCVELEHEHGAEDDPNLVYSNGNDEPHRGFGHLAFLTPDVYEASEALSKAGVLFKKKPDEGRMKGLAFAYDPSGYWIELVKRNAEAGHPEKFNLGQTMLRVKDVNKSLEFYGGKNGLGMTKASELYNLILVCELHFDSFSLYFLQSLSSEELSDLPAPDSPEAYSRMGRSWKPVLELTHNHGTENDPSFSHHNGNSEPKGFGHLGFIVEDLSGASKFLRERGVAEIPEAPIFEGKLRRFADPDGYHVQLAQRKAVLE